MLDDDGGDGREGAFPGADVVCRGWGVTEGVGGAGDGEVVHFVVEDDAGGGDDELGAKKRVDCRGEGDGEAGVVRGGDVGGALAGDSLVCGSVERRKYGRD